MGIRFHHRIITSDHRHRYILENGKESKQLGLGFDSAQLDHRVPDCLGTSLWNFAADLCDGAANSHFSTAFWGVDDGLSVACVSVDEPEARRNNKSSGEHPLVCPPVIFVLWSHDGGIPPLSNFPSPKERAV